MTIKLTGQLGNSLFQLADAYSKKQPNEPLVCIVTPLIFRPLLQLKTAMDLDYQMTFLDKSHMPIQLMQSEDIFDVPKIRSLFMFKKSIEHKSAKKLQLQQLDYSRCVGIHVRRNDYVSLQSIWRVMDYSYYESAYFKFFNGCIPLVASDDIHWCKSCFHLPDQIFIDMPEVDTMHLLSKCHHHICSCSTFSWWSAWINEQTDSLNVFPKQWFNNCRPLSQIEHAIEDTIVPKRWIRYE